MRKIYLAFIFCVFAFTLFGQHQHKLQDTLNPAIRNNIMKMDMSDSTMKNHTDPIMKHSMDNMSHAFS